MTMISSLDLFNENSGLFKAYFRRNGADVAARKAGLRMREKNEIVPHVGISYVTLWAALIKEFSENCYECQQRLEHPACDHHG